MVETIEVLVSGGNANPGPPLGPALGPMGINIKDVVDSINEATKDYEGMQVPVKLVIEDDKSFSIVVGTPPTSSLILSELKLEKGSGTPNSEYVGDLTIDQAVKVARMKKTSTLAITLKTAVKEVVGTCNSMGITIDGKSAKESIVAIDAGEYDEALNAEY